MAATNQESLARKLAVVAALRIAFVTVSLAAVFALTDSNDTAFETSQFSLVAAAYGVSLLYVLALRFRFSLPALAYGQIVVDSMLVTVLVVTTGGIDSVFTAAYVFVVIGGASTLFRRGAIIAVAVCLLLIGTLAILQVDGSFRLLHRTESSRAALSIFTYVISLSLVGGLASALAETARQTGLRLAEREDDLLRLEELHAAILRSLPAGLMTLDRAGIIRYANESAMSILQRGADTLIDRPVSDVVPPMGRAHTNLVVSGRNLNPRERYEGAYAPHPGLSLRLGFSFAPLGSHGLPEGAIVVFQDVTEIVRLKEAFERAERLATIGKLAAGLAHEVRNPLSSMCASIDVLKLSLSPPPPMQRLMDNVVREGERLNHLITDFLRFARPRELDKKMTDLGHLCRELAEVLAHDPEVGRAQLVVEADPDVLADVDADMLKQVLWNLARNAAEAMLARSGPVGPIGRICLGAKRAPPFVLLSVTDDGPGMDGDVLKRMFDPFFTTKERGTGLGLAIAHSIVEAHGGTMLVSSTLGQGTEMVLRLPTDTTTLLGTPTWDEVSSDLTAPETLDAPIAIDVPRGG